MGEVTVLPPFRLNFGKFYFLNDHPGTSSIGASNLGESPENFWRFYQNSMKNLFLSKIEQNYLFQPAVTKACYGLIFSTVEKFEVKRWFFLRTNW